MEAYKRLWMVLEASRAHREQKKQDRTVDFKRCDTQTDRHKDPCIKLRYAQVISVGPEK